jgi:hypothetical protein|tara:strand:- start:159 stop:347 length:189 start_codon:yes stop_codon:yes gene_type:complete
MPDERDDDFVIRERLHVWPNPNGNPSTVQLARRLVRKLDSFQRLSHVLLALLMRFPGVVIDG